MAFRLTENREQGMINTPAFQRLVVDTFAARVEMTTVFPDTLFHSLPPVYIR